MAQRGEACLHVPLGEETAVGCKLVGFRQLHNPLLQGSDLRIHCVDHLKHRRHLTREWSHERGVKVDLGSQSENLLRNPQVGQRQ